MVYFKKPSIDVTVYGVCIMGCVFVRSALGSQLQMVLHWKTSQNEPQPPSDDGEKKYVNHLCVRELHTNKQIHTYVLKRICSGTGVS